VCFGLTYEALMKPQIYVTQRQSKISLSNDAERREEIVRHNLPRGI
jgi:hypothetical protein